MPFDSDGCSQFAIELLAIRLTRNKLTCLHFSF